MFNRCVDFSELAALVPGVMASLPLVTGRSGLPSDTRMTGFGRAHKAELQGGARRVESAHREVCRACVRRSAALVPRCATTAPDDGTQLKSGSPCSRVRLPKCGRCLPFRIPAESLASTGYVPYVIHLISPPVKDVNLCLGSDCTKPQRGVRFGASTLGSQGRLRATV